MFIDHDTFTHEYRVECDDCGKWWLFDESEVEFAPWPHVTCPHCGCWIALF